MLDLNDTTKDTIPRFAAHTLALFPEIFGYRYVKTKDSSFFDLEQDLNPENLFRKNSVWYVHFQKHTENNTFGAALGAMAENNVDYAMSSFFLTLGRFKYVSPVTSYVKYKWVFQAI